MPKKPEPELFLSDARGIYIPRDFALSILSGCLSGVSDEDLAALKEGPDHPHYWDIWSDVLDHGTVTDPTNGTKFSIYQDGDCWLIPHGMIWNEDADGYRWPTEDED